LYQQMFLMYDLDNSGLIDTDEEIQGLFMNLWFKCLAKGEFNCANPSETGAKYMETLKHVISDGNLGFTEDEWAHWFESNVYLEHQVLDL